MAYFKYLGSLPSPKGELNFSTSNICFNLFHIPYSTLKTIIKPSTVLSQKETFADILNHDSIMVGEISNVSYFRNG